MEWNWSTSDPAVAWAMMAWLLPVIIIVAIWATIWKGFALWRSAKNGHLAWFIILMIFNTAGILEIIYLLAFGKKKESK